VADPIESSRISVPRSRLLPPVQREALILVGASGFSYDEPVAIFSCPVGTIKSRVNRARARLAKLLSIESYDFGPDLRVRAVLFGNAAIH
jgi:RNA polymerase sigma-70 factor (ECF subfamily)